LGLITFKDFLDEDEKIRPYFKASKTFKKRLDSFPEFIKTSVKARLEQFKTLKYIDPRIFISEASWKDHRLTGPNLGNFCEVHLIKDPLLVMIYYHGGRYVLLMDLVPHKFVETPKLSNQLGERLEIDLVRLKRQVEASLATWDARRVITRR